jgi:hypothetical protein
MVPPILIVSNTVRTEPQQKNPAILHFYVVHPCWNESGKIPEGVDIISRWGFHLFCWFGRISLTTV